MKMFKIVQDKKIHNRTTIILVKYWTAQLFRKILNIMNLYFVCKINKK